MRRRNIPHRKISIHALCEEGDSFSFSNRPVFSSFLSTPSARRATTYKTVAFNWVKQFLSTPSARRATIGGLALDPRDQISIHALCEEGDSLCQSWKHSECDFYPRPLRGGRRPGHQDQQGSQLISIHALCEEGDLSVIHIGDIQLQFLSTPSARRATYIKVVNERIQTISIHALCEEGDIFRFCVRIFRNTISIHALCEEGDLLAIHIHCVITISIHALCEEGDAW